MQCNKKIKKTECNMDNYCFFPFKRNGKIKIEKNFIYISNNNISKAIKKTRKMNLSIRKTG